MIFLPTRTGPRSLEAISGCGRSPCSVAVASPLATVFTGPPTERKTTRRMLPGEPIAATSSQQPPTTAQHVLKTATLARKDLQDKTSAASNRIFRWPKGTAEVMWLLTSQLTRPSSGSMRSSNSSKCTNNIRTRCRMPTNAQTSTLRSWRTRLAQPSLQIK